MGQPELDRSAYRLARNYLLDFRSIGLTERLLDEYLNPSLDSLRAASISSIYYRLLDSAQNRGMSSGVIGGAIDGIDRLGAILCSFEPAEVSRKYGLNWHQVLDDIEQRLKPRGQFRRTKRSIWPLFCRTITSGALFLSQFHSADDFYGWVDVFSKDDRVRPALPMLLSLEIEGFGFPLACDFLKELGYLDFGKPDVHIKAIFKGIGLVAKDADDYRVFKAITRVAYNQRVTPYNVDKLFWLVGSGFLYNHRHLGSGGRIGTNRNLFIREASLRLQKETFINASENYEPSNAQDPQNPLGKDKAVPEGKGKLWKHEQHEGGILEWKTCNTLSEHNPMEFKWHTDYLGNILIKSENSTQRFTAEEYEAAIAHVFNNPGGAPLGARRDGGVPHNSLGAFMENRRRTSSIRGWCSHLAAIAVQKGDLIYMDHGRGSGRGIWLYSPDNPNRPAKDKQRLS
jgi:hypothetical protein